jgi:hypothetical protein
MYCGNYCSNKSFVGIILFFFSFISYVADGMIDQLEKQKLEQIGCYVVGYINTNKILLTFYVPSCIG